MKELVAQYIRAIKNPDWNNLSISDKAEMMKVAIANGITTLPEIRRTYNEFAKGGKMNASQGYTPSDSIKKRIANWEGSSMKTNRSFEDEAKDFNRVVPAEVRNRLTQRQKDALYSYGYNVGMGRLKQRVVPVLTAYAEGKASKEDVQRAMWASRDNELRGLTTRRNAERELFGGDYRTKFTGTGKFGIHIDPSEYTIPSNYFNNFNAEITLPQMQMPNGMDVDPETLYKAPVIDETMFEKPVETVEETVYNPQEDRMEGIRRLGAVMRMMEGEDNLGLSLTKPT
uniref:Lysozyme n=1 Tax=Siphoviridae sp. ctZiV25 TaxID=2825560 RepID=A0A8S5TXR5_9CAUD|nr:MAG TPA: Lysozyme [Siphoviridae sp. ctZiV25]